MSKFLFLLSSALLAAPAYAEEEPGPDGGFRETITVTATGMDLSLRNTGQTVTVIDTEEILSVQGADFTRHLQRLPGASFSRSGPVGALTAVNIRGSDPEQLLVLIDGVRVADMASPSGGFDFGSLLGTHVGKIDLLRGSNSTIWGSDAVAGVMDISTRVETGLGASIEYGSRDTLSMSANGGIEAENHSIAISLSRFASDGFSAAAAGDEADGFEQLAFGGSAFIDVTDRIEIFATARYAESDLEIDGFPAPTFQLADTLEEQEMDQLSGAAGFNYHGRDLTLKARLSLSETELVMVDPEFGETFSSDGGSERVTVRGEYRFARGLSLAFGGEHEWSRYRTAFDAGESTWISGAYTQMGLVLGSLAAHLGLRLDDHQRFGSQVSVGGDISYDVARDTRLRVSVGEGFRAPSLFQLFSDYGNTNLSPSTSTSYDLGIEHGSRRHGIHLAATAFRRDSRDLISFISCFGVDDAICIDRPFGTYDNTDRARAQGIELEAGIDVACGLRLAGVYSFIDAEIRDTGNRLARRPRHLATLFADWETGLLGDTTHGGLRLGADMRLVGSSFENRTNTIRLDGYELVDLRAALPLNGTVELFGRIENLFDEEYQTAVGYATAGRGGFFGLRLQM